MVTKESLLRIEKESTHKFVEELQLEIGSLLCKAASKLKRTCEVPYHPALDKYFEELVNNGLKIESRTLDKITLSWLT